MSDIDTAIFNRLTGYSALTALVSTRIYRQHAPDNPTFPMITFQRISTSREMTLEGVWGLVRSLYYFDVFGDEHASTKAIANQVLAALNGLRGTYSGMDIRSVLSDDEGDSYEEDVDVHRTTLSFYITYKEQ